MIHFDWWKIRNTIINRMQTIGVPKCPHCTILHRNKRKVPIEMPFWWETSRLTRTFWIDECMVPEICYLIYAKGIRTVECCCGHGLVSGYISVDEPDIEKMESLGYKHERFRKNRKDLFYPKYEGAIK